MACRIYAFVEYSNLAIANSIGSVATGNESDVNGLFSLPLCNNNNNIITHYGLSAIIDDNTRINLLQMMQAQSDIIYAYYIVSVSKPHILQSPVSHPMLGTNNFTFDNALQDLGLQRITEPLTPDTS